MPPSHERISLGDVGLKLQTSEKRRAAVLVHGWQGNFLSTWMLASGNGLLEYLADALREWNYYSLAHSAGAFAPAAVRDVAGTVRTFLHSYVYPDADDVVLIAHSLGGLACRQAILDDLDEFGPSGLRVKGLLMFGTPNDGVSLGRAAGRFLASLSASQMQVYSETLRDLNARWLEQVTNGGRPTTEAKRRAKLLCWNVVGSADRVVRPASAAHLAAIGDVKTVPKNHRTLVKPTSSNDASVVIARDFLRSAARKADVALRDNAIDVMSAELRAVVTENPWVRKVEEMITLSVLSRDDGARFSSNEVFKCRLTTRRVGVTCSGTICVGIRLHEADHEDGIRPDCDFSIGRGVLGNTVYDEVRQGVDAERLLELVTLESVEAIHAGNRLKFRPTDPVAKAGAFRLNFECVEMPAGVTRLDEVTITISTYVDLATGWYSFVSDDTVVERLQVTFRAPFEATCLHRILPATRVTFSENTVLDGLFSSRVVVSGPAPVGTRVDWIFRR